MNVNELSLTKARDGLRKKSFSARELTEACLKHIQEADGEIHAYLSVHKDVALRQASCVDEKIKNGEMLPDCAGIPLAIKDNILIQGSPATAGSKILENYEASYDATVIQKLRSQYAVFLGKTNMDEFAMGSSTENSAFGMTRNPFDAERVPGGSSGGSSAAVSAHECIAAVGSDTGGSIRQPAAFCGTVGLKPTYGSVSRFGLIAMASSLDQIGPLTKTVVDAQILFDAIRGKDQFDSTTTQSRIKPSSRAEAEGNKELRIKNLRIGLPKEYFGKGLDPRIADSVHRSVEALVKEGAEVVNITLAHSEYALAGYYIIMPAEVSANLARFDGIRYGYSVENSPPKADLPLAEKFSAEGGSAFGRKSQNSTLYDIYAKTRAQGFGTEVKRRVMLGTYALSAGYYDAYYAKAQKVRRRIKEDFEKAFEKVDVIIGPTTPTLPFRSGEKTNDPLSMYMSDIYTVAVNLAGVPALSVPCGTVSDTNSRGLSVDLPVGLQIIGKWFSEETLFAVGEKIEMLV